MPFFLSCIKTDPQLIAIMKTSEHTLIKCINNAYLWRLWFIFKLMKESSEQMIQKKIRLTSKEFSTKFRNFSSSFTPGPIPPPKLPWSILGFLGSGHPPERPREPELPEDPFEFTLDPRAGHWTLMYSLKQVSLSSEFTGGFRGVDGRFWMLLRTSWTCSNVI